MIQQVRVALSRISSIFLSSVLIAVATCFLNVLKFSRERAVAAAVLAKATPAVFVRVMPVGGVQALVSSAIALEAST